MLKLIISLLVLVALMPGCATVPSPDRQIDTSQSDPYENINRKVYAFNNKVDEFIAKPVSDAYKKITPEFMQTGISNFYNNLNDINVILNDFLQGKFAQGSQDTRRFLMNTSLGMAGLFDVAETVGLERHEEDFDQTLAVWGVPEGDYLLIPFLGPLTYRGIPGALFDTAANPVSYTGAPLLSNFIGGPIQGLSLIDKRAKAEGSLQFINETALDPYLFMRESFLQWRRHLASDGKAQPVDLLDFEDGAEK